VSSLAYTEPASMLAAEASANGRNPLEHEANWAWNSALEIGREAERAAPELVTIKRHVLELHATEGWRLRPLEDLVRPRAFVTQRPGARPGKTERAALEAMQPAEFMRELFTRGLTFTACPDDLVYAGLLAFARTHYSASDMRAARTLTEATIRCLAVRAGIEPLTAELTS
jgi:hypothetical protein